MVTLIPWLVGGSKIVENEVEILSFDSNLGENHDLVWRPTTYPVERGADGADHIVREPAKVSLRIVFVDDPLTETPAGLDRARRKYRQLKAIAEARSLFRLVCAVDVYESMAITGIAVTRTSETGYAIEADVSFQEIIVADQVQISVPAEILSAAASTQAQGTVDAGQQGTTETTEAEEEKNQSLWYGMTYDD
uniref:Dit-like phage tail protein N-terminal domain-containing protein n=1 Tax=viral metagenome TaxID=1070528 RepID=A0A6M3LR94_9ZZZZ